MESLTSAPVTYLCHTCFDCIMRCKSDSRSSMTMYSSSSACVSIGNNTDTTHHTHTHTRRRPKESTVVEEDKNEVP